MKKLMYTVIVLVMVAAFAGCSSSKITSSWNAGNQQPAQFKKIVVAGLFDDKNRNLRRQMEEQLVQELRREGYNAVTSISVYGPKSFKNMSEEKVLKAINQNEIDGVITIGLIDKTKEKTFVYDNNYTAYGYRPWGYMYRPYYVPGFRSGHYDTDINYVFETNLYRVSNKQLIYSLQTQSSDPSTIGTLTFDYSRSVVKDLRKKNVLGS